jgi:hypothetical protein
VNACCSHCTRNMPAVWLLQAADGHIAILADGERFAVDVTRTVRLHLHLLGGFEEDAAALADGSRLDGCARIEVDDEYGWPDGMRPVALWDGGARVRLLRDLGELGETTRAYLWPYTATRAGETRAGTHARDTHDRT